ncbi:MAG: DUF2341 domain-containing protein [Pseudomonadota bacterium]
MKTANIRVLLIFLLMFLCTFLISACFDSSNSGTGSNQKNPGSDIADSNTADDTDGNQEQADEDADAANSNETSDENGTNNQTPAASTEEDDDDEPLIPSWNKRQQIEISNNTDSELLDYQVMLDVGYVSSMQADFDDLRFTASDDSTLIPYWIESKTDSSSARIWLKVPLIPASGSTTVNMYYGHTLATSVSNIGETFLFGDDFSQETINEEWTEITSGGASAGTLANGKWTKACDGDCDWWTGADFKAGIYVDDLGGKWEAVTLLTTGSQLNLQHYGLMNFEGLQDGYMWGPYSTSAFYLEVTGTGGLCSLVFTDFPVYLKISNITGNSPEEDNTYNYYMSEDGLTWTHCEEYTAIDTMGSIGLFVKDWGEDPVSASFDFFYLKQYAASEPTVSWGEEASSVTELGLKKKRYAVNNNTATALTNHQAEFIIDYDTDMQPDFDDLRFTAADGTTILDYWLESKADSASANIWVKIPQIPASGNTTVFMYYGNSSSASASSFDDTMTNDYSADEKLLLQWLMDAGSGTSIADTSGNNNNGTLTVDGDGGWYGSDNYFTTGDALNFDGSDGDQVSSDVQIDTNLNGDFTLETWIMIDEISSHWGPVFNQLNGNDFNVTVQTGGCEIVLGFSGMGSEYGIGCLEVDTWSHLVVTHDKTEANAFKVYIDSVLERTADFQGLSPNSTSTFALGNDQWGQVLNGRLDEVRVYTRYMTANEVLAHYEHRKYAETELSVQEIALEESVSAVDFE